MNVSDFEKYMKIRPHVVILGAGASCAAIPKGDKYGKKISAMKGFIETLGLKDLLTSIELKTSSDNLEDIFMEIDERSYSEIKCLSIKNILENKIYDYMSNYTIPDLPTVYDFLLLSLTSKDLVATFNWDPLLVQAYLRCQKITANLPYLVFLHGNVAAGYCEKDNVIGNIGTVCKCGEFLSPVKLLYPIKNKDYTSDIAIKKSWKTLKNALEKAYMVTIFGYSAPKSDIAAMNMLKQAWGDVSSRNLEEIEIIDICDERKAFSSWNNFIHTHHYSFHNSLFTTSLACYPRRSCEATFDRLMNCRFLHNDCGFNDTMSFNQIEKLLAPLIKEEEIKKKTGEMLSTPY